MKKAACAFFALVCLVLTSSAWGEPVGGAEVRALGLLNGEALACGQLALVERIRSHVVYEAAKTRAIGEIFEAATQERFLEMGKGERPCMDARTLAQQIEEAVAALKRAYASKP
ncbi:MAG: hypothetical protein N2441_00025 [Rhodocyclaceae bacterium]|nr:hypothetical protein [Rhodocyclaceae bacterium]